MDNNGRTALHTAICELILRKKELKNSFSQLGYEEVVEMLAKNGININAMDKDRKTALEYANESGKFDDHKLKKKQA